MSHTSHYLKTGTKKRSVRLLLDTMYTFLDRNTYIQKYVQTEIYTYRKAYIQKDIHTERHTCRKTYRQKGTQAEIHTDRNTYIQTERQTYRSSYNIQPYVYSHLKISSFEPVTCLGGVTDPTEDIVYNTGNNPRRGVVSIG